MERDIHQASDHAAIWADLKLKDYGQACLALEAAGLG